MSYWGSHKSYALIYAAPRLWRREDVGGGHRAFTPRVRSRRSRRRPREPKQQTSLARGGELLGFVLVINNSLTLTIQPVLSTTPTCPRQSVYAAHVVSRLTASSRMSCVTAQRAKRCLARRTPSMPQCWSKPSISFRDHRRLTGTRASLPESPPHFISVATAGALSGYTTLLCRI